MGERGEGQFGGIDMGHRKMEGDGWVGRNMGVVGCRQNKSGLTHADSVFGLPFDDDLPLCRRSFRGYLVDCGSLLIGVVALA